MTDAPAVAADEPRKLVDEAVKDTAEEREKAETATEISGEQKGGKTSMSVKIHSPFKEYYFGPAFSLSAVNATGPFDILPGHHNFISLLSPCELVVRTDKGEQKIQIAGGIVHVKADKTIVFLDV